MSNLYTLVESLTKDDWRKIKQASLVYFVDNGVKYKESNWFLVQCIVTAFVDMLISKGYKELK